MKTSLEDPIHVGDDKKQEDWRCRMVGDGSGLKGSSAAFLRVGSTDAEQAGWSGGQNWEWKGAGLR